jgi:hypothetical protein
MDGSGHSRRPAAAAFPGLTDQEGRHEMTSISKVAVLSAGILAIIATGANAQAIDSTGERYIPQGHSYSSSNQRMPTLNSYEDQINNGADQLQTEIYRKRRDRAFWDSWVNSTHGTYLGGEPRLAPDY